MNATHRSFLRRSALASLLTALAACNLSLEAKVACDIDDDCLAGNVCRQGTCARPDDTTMEPGEGGTDDSGALGDGDGDARDAGGDGPGLDAGGEPNEGGSDALPAPVLDVPSGGYGLLTFSVFGEAGESHCVRVTNVEPEARVHYTLSTDDSEPPEPTADSMRAAEPFEGETLPLVCGIALEGVTRLRVVQVVDGAPPGPEAAYRYVIDKHAPAPPVPSKSSGAYNAASAFDCITLAGIEPGGRADYRVSYAFDDESIEGVLTAEDNTICGIRQNGTTFVSIYALDAVGNPSLPEELQLVYELDSTLPVVHDFTHDADLGLSFLHHTIHFRARVAGIEGGSVEVSFGARALSLRDDGMLGDVVADDGVWELDYLVVAADHASVALPSVVATDPAGNATTPLAAQPSIAIDAQGTSVGGATYSADAVWDGSASPYVIDGDVFVAESATLSIAAGSALSFVNGGRLVVAGQLQVLGTAPQRVLANGGTILLQGTDAPVTYDGAGDYVAGVRLEGLWMPHGFVDAVGSGVYRSAYVRDSTLGTIHAYTLSGWLIAHSRIGELRGVLSADENLRIEDSYLDVARDLLCASCVIDRCAIGALTIAGTPAMTACDIGELFFAPAHTGVALHGNNFGTTGAPIALTLTSGPSASPVDLTANYWGVPATAQMQAEGESVNIDAIFDFRDDATLRLVDYAGFLTSAVPDAGPTW